MLFEVDRARIDTYNIATFLNYLKKTVPQARVFGAVRLYHPQIRVGLSKNCGAVEPGRPSGLQGVPVVLEVQLQGVPHEWSKAGDHGGDGAYHLEPSPRVPAVAVV